MKNQSAIVVVLLILLPVAIFALGLVAWLLAGDPGADAASRDIENAVKLAVGFDGTSMANLASTPVEIEPDSFRTTPSSIAEFRIRAPTISPDPTQSIIYGDPAIILGEFTWINSFDEGSLPLEDQTGCTRVTFADGRMLVSETGAEEKYCTVLVQPGSSDYYLEVQAAPRTVCSDAEFGLYLNGSPTGDGVFFSVTCDGGYGLTYNSSEFGGIYLRNRAVDPLVSGAGPGNRIGVLVRGDQLYLYVDGTLLSEMSDARFLKGDRFGLFVRSSLGNPVTVAFDNLIYWDLSE